MMNKLKKTVMEMTNPIGQHQELQENEIHVEKKEPALVAPSKGAIEQDEGPAGAGCAGRIMKRTAEETGRSTPEPGTVAGVGGK